MTAISIPLCQPQATQQLEGWAREFGGNYELYLFGRRAVVVTEVGDIRRILTLRPSKFKRGVKSVSTLFIIFTDSSRCSAAGGGLGRLMLFFGSTIFWLGCFVGHDFFFFFLLLFWCVRVFLFSLSFLFFVVPSV